MSLTPAQLLTVMEALSAKAQTAGSLIDYFIPTPFSFGSKDALFNALDASKTPTERAAQMIYAMWIDYLRFEDFEPLSDCTGARYYFEFTVFHESNEMRIDESDEFEKQVLRTKQDHVADIMRLRAAFKGTQDIPALSSAIFSVKETVALIQPENTARDIEPTFILNGVTGSETKLQCVVNIQPVRD
jgi:hypothetical protein